MERYAERVRGHDDKASITEYIANNEDKIKSDIQKMVEYGEEVYFGPGRESDRAKRHKIRLIIKDAWFLLLNEDGAVMTLYKKDFGIEDEDFNKQYAKKVIDEFARLKQEIEEAEIKAEDSLEQLNSKIDIEEDAIKSYRNAIKQREERLFGLKKERDAINIETTSTKDALRRFVNGILGKRVFD